MADNPYRALPDHCFWKRGIGAVAPEDVDPIVSVPFSIGRTDRIATAGSCFAQHIGRHLARFGFGHLTTEPPHPLLNAEEAFLYNYGTYTARYGNIYTVRQLLQLFKRAYGTFQPAEDVWVDADGWRDPFRPQIQPEAFVSREEHDDDRSRHLAAVRKAFGSLSVFVFTLGLTEAWESSIDGAVFPLCPGVAGGTFDASRHRFRAFTVTEVIDDGLEFIDLLRKINPAARIILTVSPVALAATARADEHVLTATTYSKAVLRVACAELVRQRPQVAYVPSYEIITGSHARGRYFAPDGRSVNEAGVAHVMRVFLKHFAGLDIGIQRMDPTTTPRAVETGGEPAEPGMEELVAIHCEEAMLADAAAPAGQRYLAPRCNVCGGSDFGPGPGGRMMADGRGPCCRGCGSLERDRAVAGMLQVLQPETLFWERALLVGSGHCVERRWFGTCDVVTWPAGRVGAAALTDRPAGHYDLVCVIYLLELAEDDRALFGEIVRVLSPKGILVIRFIEPERRDTTVPPAGPWVAGRPYRLYGRDVADYFGCREAGLAIGTVVGMDPLSGQRHRVHVFAKTAESLEPLLRAHGVVQSPAR